MTNLEKYFGIKVHFKEILDPLELTYLRERAVKISRLKNFNINDFSVYVHSMHVHINHTHFSKHSTLAEKIQELQVKFRVNPKQARSGKIKFYNELARRKPMEGVDEAYEDTALIKYYSGDTLNKNNYFKTELITYIDKSLRRDSHKKIKVQIKPIPTEEYRSVLNTKKEEIFTLIDLRLIKNIQLKIHFATDEEKLENKKFLNCMSELIKLKDHLSTQNNGVVNSDIKIIEGAIDNLQNRDESSLKSILNKISMDGCSIANEIGLKVLLGFLNDSKN